MHDMKMSKKEKKKNEMGCMPHDDGGDKYPYGLELRLDDESLEKLKAELKTGQMVSIMAYAKVTETKEHDKGKGEVRSATLQITDLEVKPKDEGNPGKMSMPDYRKSRKNA